MIIFLDIDGVLNDHTPMENRYNGTKPECVSCFNRLLRVIPDAKIVISSAWRYLMLRGDMTVKGFEMLLQTHGINCRDIVIGHTKADGPIEEEPHHHDEPERWRLAGLRWRAEQIRTWVDEHKVKSFIVLDDLDLSMDELYLVDGTKGLASADVPKIVDHAFKRSMQTIFDPIPSWMFGKSVEARNALQNCGRVHPYTCGNDRTDEAHKAYQAKHGGDWGQLVAVEGGWLCPVCGYRQGL